VTGRDVDALFNAAVLVLECHGSNFGPPEPNYRPGPRSRLIGAGAAGTSRDLAARATERTPQIARRDAAIPSDKAHR